MTAIAKSSPVLERWFQRQHSARRRYVSLFSLVFGIDLLRYFFYRTRYMAAVALLRISLHIAEFSLMIYVLPTVVYHAMVFRLISLAIESAWWGTTDPMRHRIRLLRKQRDLQGIQREMAGWLTLALLLAMTVLLAALAAAWWRDDGYRPFGVLIVAIGFQTSVRILSRTFYSGAYALRRVFLPIELILGPEILIFLLGLALQSWLGEWSVTVCVLCSTLVIAAISYRYVRHVTDFLRITPERFFSRDSFAHVFIHHRLFSLAVPALAALGVRLHDAWLIAALQIAGLRNPEAQKLLFALYLVMPLLRSCMNWSQIMYFDLSKYSLDMFARFRTTLEHIGIVYSLLLSSLLGLMAAIVLWMFAADPFQNTLFIILTYMIVSSVLGFVLISLFSRRRYGMVIALCVIQYGLWWPLLISRADHFSIHSALMISLLIPLGLGWWQLQARWWPPFEQIEPYLRWVSAVCVREHPAIILRLLFHPAATKQLLIKSAREIAFNHYDDALITRTDESLLVALNRNHIDLQALRKDMVRLCGGFVIAIDIAEGGSGKEAYAQVLAMGIGRQALASDVRISEALAGEFLQRFPAGFVQYPMRKNDAVLNVTDSNERRQILHEARRGAGLAHKQHLPQWFITAAYLDPYINMIFIAPKTSGSDAMRKEWQELLDCHNLAALHAKYL